MIRSGVTALFETGRTEVSDEEIDILLGRREGVVDNAINEADDERTAKLWQQKDEMQLEVSESDSQPRHSQTSRVPLWLPHSLTSLFLGVMTRTWT